MRVVLRAAIVVAVVASGVAVADPAVRTITGELGRRLAIDTPVATDRARPQISRTLYLERCRGGCPLTMGPNDARSSTTMLLLLASATISEFANTGSETGVLADPEWDAIVLCMKEVYSPYDVEVTDQKPPAGASFHEAIIAGHPQEAGRTADILGVSPLANDCSAIDNVISLTFANQHSSPTPAARTLSICWTAAQESAHAFGLDHEYEFLVGKRSTCSDPMTYRSDCGGEKFFRDEPATCGENSPRACKCGDAQNSHRKLLSVFGPGTPITRPPTVTMVDPVLGGSLPTVVAATAGAQRGVARVELWLNGNKWAQDAGAPFGRNGQPDPSNYQITVPADVPNSILDVETVAFDDLGIQTASAPVTVTKGGPCETAATCAKFQQCAAGRCFWDPPIGELGDACEYAQFCKTGVCQGTPQICTQTCIAGVADACPAGFDCAPSGTTATDGVCEVRQGGGCCSVGGSGDGWAQLGIGAAALAFAIRKRRR